MNIYVEETTFNNLGKFIVRDTMDEKKFIDLYGSDYYLNQLKTQGKTGDAIGQGRYFFAEVVKEGVN